MLIDTIVDFCDTAYKADDCCNCSYGDNCPKRCDTCLHYIHTPTAVPAPRQYDCPRRIFILVNTRTNTHLNSSMLCNSSENYTLKNISM